jgi:hypothetical protein
VAALNFTTPDVGGTAGARDGNSAAERTAISATVSSLNIANGATVWIRWVDFNASGSDDGLAVDDFSLTPAGGVVTTDPSATGTASPSPVVAGSSTTLSATVTPGTNPASTGTAVSCDLTAIGGSATFSLAGSGVSFSSAYTVPANTTITSYSLPCTVSDAQSRTGNFNIALIVSSFSTSPTGTGAANPSSVQAGASTLLTVTVTPGGNPVSTGLTVTVDLSSIGGSASQTFFDNGTNGDVLAGDSIFSFQATVTSGTTPGTKSLSASILDGQARTGTASIALTVQFPPAPSTVKISQVYGGGGNSGATYTNDFIEIYNQSAAPVDISLWSIQQASASFTGAWSVTPLCPANGSCILQPGHYYLVQEAQGAGGTTALPAADITGALNLGAASGKVALVNNTTALAVACPASSSIADLVGYGGAGTPNCFETTATGALTNTTAAVRKGNGCTDTDNNANDFVTIGPIPRNSSSPVNTCGGNPTVPSGVGTASPASVDPAGNLLLTVTVTPATTPPSTGITVTGNLTSIGGSASQTFYDDGTNGDVTAGDNVFSFRTASPADAATGVKNIPVVIADAQSRTAPAPITITVQSPTCGVERWSVKVGTDPDAGLVNLGSPVRSTIAALRGIPAPASPPLNARVAPTETTVYLVNGIINVYKLEDDVDYHIVFQDPIGNTMVTEIPSPACDGSTSPFDAAVAAVRAKFDAHFSATSNFQTANLPVQMKGVGFFDFIHGQTGVAPNGIELHPILDFTFTTASTVTVSASANPSVYGQPVNIIATVASTAGIPTGAVSFFDDGDPIGTSTIGPNGQAVFSSSTLIAGAHTITASYDGDSQAAQSSTTVGYTLNITQASPVITWANPADITFGGSIGSAQLNATASVPGAFVYTPAAGTVLPAGNGQTLSVVFTPSSSNYVAVSKSVAINVVPVNSGGSPANVVVSRVLSRTGGQVIATLTISNNGGTEAPNVIVTTAKIGTVTTVTALPQSLGTIAPGGSVQIVAAFPGTVGAAGAGSSMSVSGTYNTGSFSNTARITLP